MTKKKSEVSYTVKKIEVLRGQLGAVADEVNGIIGD
jgi:hypothetical protein